MKAEHNTAEHQHIDSRLMFLHRAAARLTLFECGEFDLDAACRDSVAEHWTFWRACDRCDQRARQREDPNLARLSRLLEDDVSLDRACAALNSNRPTPESTIAAIKQAVRDRGANALDEPQTRARMQRCDVP